MTRTPTEATKITKAFRKTVELQQKIDHARAMLKKKTEEYHDRIDALKKDLEAAENNLDRALGVSPRHDPVRPA